MKNENDHDDHVKFKLNCDLNKLLLDSKTCMKKLQFNRAYEILKLPILKGLKHADVYYMFGEVCRLLKKLEDSERYLLEAIKFECYSPFAFLSLGLLYQELGQHKNAINFLKHFTDIMVNIC